MPLARPALSRLDLNRRQVNVAIVGVPDELDLAGGDLLEGELERRLCGVDSDLQSRGELAAGMLLAAGIYAWRPPDRGQQSVSREQRPEVGNPQAVDPAELAAAAQQDRNEAAAMDAELIEARLQLEMLEASLRPMSDDGLTTEEAEIKAALERLESEVQATESTLNPET